MIAHIQTDINLVETKIELMQKLPAGKPLEAFERQVKIRQLYKQLNEHYMELYYTKRVINRIQHQNRMEVEKDLK